MPIETAFESSASLSRREEKRPLESDLVKGQNPSTAVYAGQIEYRSLFRMRVWRTCVLMIQILFRLG